jgi:hypothetical protein
MSSRDLRERLDEANERMNEPMWSEIQAANVAAMHCCRAPDVSDGFERERELLARAQKAERELLRVQCAAESLSNWVIRLTVEPCTHQHSNYTPCPYCEARRKAYGIRDSEVINER